MASRLVGRIFLAALLLTPLAAAADSKDKDDFPFLEATVAQLQHAMASGRLTSEQLTRAYIERIQKLDQPKDGSLGLNAIIELNPDAIALARQADALRRKGKVLGPLHGIPILLKANIDTADKMQTWPGRWHCRVSRRRGIRPSRPTCVRAAP
jgi:amidase